MDKFNPNDYVNDAAYNPNYQYNQNNQNNQSGQTSDNAFQSGDYHFSAREMNHRTEYTNPESSEAKTSDYTYRPAQEQTSGNYTYQQTFGQETQSSGGYAYQQTTGQHAQPGGNYAYQNASGRQTSGQETQSSGGYTYNAQTGRNDFAGGGNGPTGPVKKEKKKGGFKSFLRKAWKPALCAVLVCAIAFGGGYLGVQAGYANLEPVVINQISQETDSDPADTGTQSAGTESTPGTVSNQAGTVTSDSSENLTSEQVAAKVVPTVVAITTEQMTTSQFWGGSYVSSGAGSGVIISADGYILTSAHVITGATTINVETHDGKTYVADVVGSYVDGDIAVIKIDATGLSYATLGNSDKLVQGSEIYAVGNPTGRFSGSITEGIVSALNRSIQVSVEVENDNSQNYQQNSPYNYYNYFFGNSSYGSYSTTKTITLNVIQYSAAISPGNSGGGLFNAKGELVGIVCAKSSTSSSEGLSFAVPINNALTIAQSLISTGSYTPASSGQSADNSQNSGSSATNTNKAILGIKVATLTADEASQYGFTSGAGVYISDITAQSASQAGLQLYDRIISVDGTMVTTYEDLTGYLADKNVGDTVSVAVERSGKMVTCSVKLIANSSN